MPKLFTSGNSGSLYKSTKAKKSALDAIYEKGLIDEKKGFTQVAIRDWEEFGRFVKKLDRDLKRTSNLTLIVLSSALVAEGIFDLILIKIYSLDKYKKYSPFDFLSKIDFNDKLTIIKKFKDLYKTKKPKHKRYKEYFMFTPEVWRALKDKLGQEVVSKLIEISEELNAKNGIKKPKTDYLVVKPLAKIKPESTDYLTDDVVKFLKTVNTKEIKTLLELRNIVSHEWKPEEKISKKLKMPISKLAPHVRALCIDTVNNLIGLKLQK